MGNFYLGNLFQGFSAHWWSTKHFRHHALPNGWLLRPGGEVVVFDNDVNTAPFLLWCSYLEGTIPELARRWILPFQHLYALVLLCLAKASWNLASFTTAVQQRQWVDVAGAVLHYAGFLGAGYWLSGGDVCATLTWFLGGMAIGGFLLGFVFIQSHNGTETLKGFEHGFFTSQMLTTRNVSTDAFTTWFTGGAWPRIARACLHLPAAARCLALRAILALGCLPLPRWNRLWGALWCALPALLLSMHKRLRMLSSLPLADPPTPAPCRGTRPPLQASTTRLSTTCSHACPATTMAGSRALWWRCARSTASSMRSWGSLSPPLWCCTTCT